MNKTFRVFFGITTLFTLLIAAYALGMTRNRAEHVTAPATATHADPVAARLAEQALEDMKNVARRELGAYRLQPGSLGSTAHWSADHLLHWVTVEHEGHEIRLYHVTETAHPEHRHTATWSSHEPYPTRWERVR